MAVNITITPTPRRSWLGRLLRWLLGTALRLMVLAALLFAAVYFGGAIATILGIVFLIFAALLTIRGLWRLYKWLFRGL